MHDSYRAYRSDALRLTPATLCDSTDASKERIKAFKYVCLKSDLLAYAGRRMVLVDSPSYICSLGHFAANKGGVNQEGLVWSSAWGVLLCGAIGKEEAKIFLQGGNSLGFDNDDGDVNMIHDRVAVPRLAPFSLVSMALVPRESFKKLAPRVLVNPKDFQRAVLLGVNYIAVARVWRPLEAAEVLDDIIAEAEHEGKGLFDEIEKRSFLVCFPFYAAACVLSPQRCAGLQTGGVGEDGEVRLSSVESGVFPAGSVRGAVNELVEVKFTPRPVGAAGAFEKRHKGATMGLQGGKLCGSPRASAGSSGGGGYPTFEISGSRFVVADTCDHHKGSRMAVGGEGVFYFSKLAAVTDPWLGGHLLNLIYSMTPEHLREAAVKAVNFGCGAGPFAVKGPLAIGGKFKVPLLASGHLRFEYVWVLRHELR